MLPTNSAKGQGCSPVSSNCVIWQGPDIPCINLCHGDSVTDVVFKLATELCNILDTLDIKTYDIECFKPICPDPQNFHDLIQFLITKICELQCCCDGTKPSQSACPDDCIVTVSSCFYFQNQLGDQITTMTLKDYVLAIGNKLCTIIPQLNLSSAKIAGLEDDQAMNTVRFNGIDEQLADFTILLPSSCLLGVPPPEGWPIQDVVTNLETEFCALEARTGTPEELFNAINKQCANIDALRTLTNRQMTYSGLNGWVTALSYDTVADSINNMWLMMCDMRAAVENILLTCCCTDCDDVNITFTATLQGDPATTVTLWFTGTIPTGLTDCFPSGNLVTITDAYGGSYTTYVQVVNNLNGSVNISLSGTPVNVATNLTIVIQGCWKRPAPGSDCGGLECARMLTYTIQNSAPCPILNISEVTVDSISWNYLNAVAGPGSYSIELRLASDDSFVNAQGGAIPAIGVTPVGTFNSLLCSTDYYLQAKITINAVVTTCPPVAVSTPACPCVPCSIQSTVSGIYP